MNIANRFLVAGETDAHTQGRAHTFTSPAACRQCARRTTLFVFALRIVDISARVATGIIYRRI